MRTCSLQNGIIITSPPDNRLISMFCILFSNYFRERCEAVDNMLEKQADLIRYYKESNEQLNRRILELTVQCRNHSINS